MYSTCWFRFKFLCERKLRFSALVLQKFELAPISQSQAALLKYKELQASSTLDYYFKQAIYKTAKSTISPHPKKYFKWY
jgi:hypothetical protein